MRARAVINATGVFSDGIRKMDEPEAKTVVAASQGSHLVLPKAFLPGNSAVMVPHTPDGRVLFAVPWHDHVVVGTTDISVDNISLEPVPMDEEIGFILTNAAKYLSKRPSRSDILSVYAGLRPLVKAGDAKSTSALSRDHTILISNAGLLTIAGRQMDDLSEDGPGCRRTGADDGRIGGAPLHDRAFANPWMDQAKLSRSPTCKFTVLTRLRFRKSRGKSLPWRQNFTLNCLTPAPKSSGP